MLPVSQRQQGSQSAVHRTSPSSEIEGNQFTVVLDQHYRLRFPGFDIAAHSRRIGRHPGQGQSNRVGPLVEKKQYGSGRNVSFDHILIDQRSVARPGALGNTMIGFEFSQLWIFGEIDIGSKIL